MALVCGVCLALAFSSAHASLLNSQTELSHAKAWLAQHTPPSAAALADLKATDPNSYALVQRLLSSDSVVLSLEHAEAKALDTPQRRLKPRHNLFAGLQGHQQKQVPVTTLAKNRNFQDILQGHQQKQVPVTTL